MATMQTGGPINRNESVIRGQPWLVCLAIPKTLFLVTLLLLVSGVIPVHKVHISRGVRDDLSDGVPQNPADAKIGLTVSVGVQLLVAAIASGVPSLSHSKRHALVPLPRSQPQSRR